MCKKAFTKHLKFFERYSPTWMCIRFHIFKISSEARKGMEWNFARGKPCISSQYTHISKRRKCSPVKWHRVTSSSWTQFCVFFGGSLRYGKYGISYNWSISENLIKALRRSLEFHKHCVCVTHFPLGDHQRGIQQIPKYIRSLTSNNFLFHHFQKKVPKPPLVFLHQYQMRDSQTGCSESLAACPLFFLLSIIIICSHLSFLIICFC